MGACLALVALIAAAIEFIFSFSADDIAGGLLSGLIKIDVSDLDCLAERGLMFSLFLLNIATYVWGKESLKAYCLALSRSAIS